MISMENPVENINSFVMTETSQDLEDLQHQQNFQIYNIYGNISDYKEFIAKNGSMTITDASLFLIIRAALFTIDYLRQKSEYKKGTVVKFIRNIHRSNIFYTHCKKIYMLCQLSVEKRNSSDFISKLFY